MSSARKVLEDSMNDDIGFDKIANHSSEQILHVLKVLKEYQPDLSNNDEGNKILVSIQLVLYYSY